jgi:hypothetical protein
MGPKADPLAGRVFAALVLACFAAFFVTQRLKHTPLAVQEFKREPFFSPTRAGRHKQERISFKLPRAERITVQIVSTSGGGVVATLARDLPAPRYKKVSLRWNGRRGTAREVHVRRTRAGTLLVVPVNRGRPAPAGEYRVRVVREHGRPVLVPIGFTLVRR